MSRTPTKVSVGWTINRVPAWVRLAVKLHGRRHGIHTWQVITRAVKGYVDSDLLEQARALCESEPPA